MKIKFLTLITLLTFTLSATIATAATTTDSDETTVLSTTSNINKIEVSGNVEVYITNGDKDEVKVYDNYYEQSALVQDKDGVLRISSYNTDKLMVLVTVVDLRSVIANDNASVKTYGTLSAIDLSVILNNTASAQLKLNTLVADIRVNDRAAANLSGSVNDYTLAYSQLSSVNRAELAAVNTTEINTTKQAARFIEEKIASL